jgi:hypothetical protein
MQRHQAASCTCKQLLLTQFGQSTEQQGRRAPWGRLQSVRMVFADTVYLLVLNEHRRVEGRVARRELASAPWVVQDGAIRLQPEAPERRIVHFLALVVIRGKPELRVAICTVWASGRRRSEASQCACALHVCSVCERVFCCAGGVCSLCV